MRPWTIPTIYTVAALAAAVTVPRLESTFFPSLTHTVSAAAAMAFFSATASGILAFTAIVFSIAFVMVQFSAMAYSPRLVLWFANRPALYHSLGIFIATFAYAMAALLWTDRGGSGSVPLVSTLIVAALLVASMVSFAILVQSLGSLQITEVLNLVGRQGRHVVEEEEQRRSRAATRDPRRLVLAPEGLGRANRTIRHVGEPRCVMTIDPAMLVDLAQRSNAILALAVSVGDTLVEGSPILEMYGSGAEPDTKDLAAAVKLGSERTFEQDPKYAIRLLVDIAIKALSPAINDPTTAVQAIDQIDDLLRRLSRLDLGSVWLADDRGEARLFLPLPSWDDYLSLAFDEIRQFGISSVQVMRRLRGALEGLDEIQEREDRRASIRAYLAHLDGAIAHSTLDLSDRVTASRIDMQGLGFSRATRPQAPRSNDEMP